MTLIPDDKIREMQERTDKASPEPWGVENGAVWTGEDYAFDPQEPTKRAKKQAARNVEFAAHARADIPKLLEERKELLAERNRLAGIVEKLAQRSPVSMICGSSVYSCSLCGDAWRPGSKDFHLVDCPYRLAVEWQAEQQPVGAEETSDAKA